MSRFELPIFPLHTVLFPASRLALRIFEPRYLDLVCRTLRDGSSFGVVLIRDGSETGEAAEIHGVGTTARISRWEQRSDNLLGITITGERRFRILDSKVREDQLRIAEVELLPEDEAVPLPDKYQHMADKLRPILDDLSHPYITMPRHYDDAAWVGGRLAELLPLELDLKQRLLQVDGPLRRLEIIDKLLLAGRDD